MSEYQQLLSCWHKLEHFSPTEVPKSRKIEEIKTGSTLPWQEQKINFPQSKVVIHTIYLGVFPISEVIGFAEKFYEVKNTNENLPDNSICYASIKLDTKGKYIENTFGISTLPWALSQLEQDKIKTKDWHSGFQHLKTNLIELANDILFDLIDRDGENERIPAIQTYESLLELQELIHNEVSWSQLPELKLFYQKKERDLNTPEKQQGKVIESPEILNSFYVEDLEKIINDFKPDKAPKAFLKYVQGNLDIPIDKKDLRIEASVLEGMLRPLNFPDGCWPSNYQLSLMQQFALNNVHCNMLIAEKSQNLFTVNGPPGTGKTTLLRDMIASILVERAKEMIKFKDPYDAFDDFGKVQNDSDFDHSIYIPKKELTQFGMVIASSNNGAVENISKELPLKEAVAPFESEIRYFSKVAEQGNKDNWGLISAVLGNMKNRKKFVETYWIRYEDDTYKKVGLQKLFLDSNINGLEEWILVVKNFKAKLQEVEKEKERLEDIRARSKKESQVINTLDKSAYKITKNEELLSQIRFKEEKLISSIERLKNDKEDLKKDLDNVKDYKPNFFELLFRTKSARIYKSRKNALLNELDNIQHELSIVKKEDNSLKAKIESLNEVSEALREERLKSQEILKNINEAKKELGENYANNEFWNMLETKKAQTSCPWYSKRLKTLQTDLFILSLRVNELFLLTANRKNKCLTKTLSAFMDVLKGKMQTVEKEKLKALWNTYLMVIPIVSTTFASVKRLFNGLDTEDLPWLFIDEAGQAVPQAAAGAIWRAKNVVVVGDPLQIEPVVTIPEIITNNLRKDFELTKSQIDTELSVQSCADRANPFGTFLSDEKGNDIWIGTQLRVHRRCQEPMFTIANRIAYNNSMFSAVSKENISPINFKTNFLHCSGIVTNRHYSEEHAVVVKDFLEREMKLIDNEPNVYVITPFKEISQELRRYIKENLLFLYPGFSPEKSKIKFAQWVNEHIGTIHTFQGKQADGVILCLGLDKKTESSASWASQKPNILNVALTRAKYRFMAVGDQDIWLKQPYFKQLKELKS